MVYGDQDSATAAEGTATPGQRNVHSLSKEKEKEKEKDKQEEPPNDEPKEPSWAQSIEETKKVQLFEGNPNKQVIISASSARQRDRGPTHQVPKGK